jgi:hypothetical protein
MVLQKTTFELDAVIWSTVFRNEDLLLAMFFFLVYHYLKMRKIDQTFAVEQT